MRRFVLLLALFSAGLATACSKGPDATNATVPVAKATPVAAPAGGDWTQVVSPTPAGGFVMGNPQAAIKLIEYGSRTCPVCGLFGQTGMRPLEDTYVKSGKVSYEFRDFLVHSPDLGVALLGRCVPTAAFFPLLEQMYVQQPSFQPKFEAAEKDTALNARLQAASPAQAATIWVDYLGYVDFVKQRGLAEPAARACLGDAKQIDAVAGISKKAMDDEGVTGTPTFVLNGQKLDVVQWSQLEPLLKQAGA